MGGGVAHAHRKKTVLFILVDAFRHDYINVVDTPFLAALAKRSVYIKKIKSSFGFCECSEILTGCYPSQTGNFTAMGYTPAKAPLGFLKRMGHYLDSPFLDSHMGRCALNRLLRFCGKSFPIYDIPLSLLPELSLMEDARPHVQPGAFAVESLLDVMQRENKTVSYQSFTALNMDNGTDEERVHLLYQNIAEGYDAHFLFLGKVDNVTHQYGTRALERHEVVREVDRQVQDIVSTMESAYTQCDAVILGDHGMVDIAEYFNVADKVKKMCVEHGLVFGRDIRLFLDATLARFWYRSRKAEVYLRRLLHSYLFTSKGYIVTKDLAAQYRIPFGDRRYGDIVWCIQPGKEIFPNYFHFHKRVKAMHGYAPDYPDEKGMCVYYTSRHGYREVEEAALVDICAILADALEIPSPKDSVGKLPWMSSV